MPFGLFSSKSPANIYEKHLPQNLYEFLSDLNLLDGEKHTYKHGKMEATILVKRTYHLSNIIQYKSRCCDR